MQKGQIPFPIVDAAFIDSMKNTIVALITIRVLKVLASEMVLAESGLCIKEGWVSEENFRKICSCWLWHFGQIWNL
jgi:hypothetical protein